MEKVVAVKSPEWQLDFQEYLERLRLTEYKFRDQLQLPVIRKVRKVLPLKDVTEIESLVPMTKEMRREILTKIKTGSGESPFAESHFELRQIDPNLLKIGQRFVYRENYTSLLEQLTGLLCHNFVIASGITNLGAFVIFGYDAEHQPVISFYLPPIIEQHHSELLVMDGMHRNYLTKQVGATISAIVAKNVAVPFPCLPKDWKELKVINLAEKPASKNERYFGLREELFRDLKYLGIDG